MLPPRVPGAGEISLALTGRWSGGEQICAWQHWHTSLEKQREQAKIQGKVSRAAVSLRIVERAVEDTLFQVCGHGDHDPGGKTDAGIIPPPDPCPNSSNNKDGTLLQLTAGSWSTAQRHFARNAILLATMSSRAYGNSS